MACPFHQITRQRITATLFSNFAKKLICIKNHLPIQAEKHCLS